MPKVEFIFDLPEDNHEFKVFSNGNEYWTCLWSLVEREIRGKLKYGNEFKSPEEALEWVREYIHDNVDIYCVEG